MIQDSIDLKAYFIELSCFKPILGNRRKKCKAFSEDFMSYQTERPYIIAKYFLWKI